ncbi:hypothetical protein PGT21_033838 [Puccinia graminis f. sp. tritici]|uniref:Integrase catalytic domain-containing protein n=1 Tax=Puccinia graminis f. sp. tritici TaxID=56615 RepID=A0A5B0M224_PUCGR|nr:hypothetical protein PGT21_033838 [Puccinia graminis f. sp. tritici]
MDILTSDYPDTSGTDDDPNPEESDQSTIEDNCDTLTSDDLVKSIVQSLLTSGHKGPKILQILREQHGISMSASTLTRKRQTWALRQVDLPQKPPKLLDPMVRASILSSHSKGLNLKEIQARLNNETGVSVCSRTVKRYMNQLQVKILRNDVADGKVTMVEVYEAVAHAREYLLQDQAGYRRMRTILLRNYKIQIPRQMVYDALKHIDPEGMAARLRQTCKRRIFRTHGPNHVWACDGHDKLKKFGITVYGFIDAWSRKILGLHVHVTNNDPRHIGVYFLQLVQKVGGVPRKVTADHGTETPDMSWYQMKLSHEFAGITLEEAKNRMHHTKSTRNQKIEALWSQMMKQHNRSIIDNIWSHIEAGVYDREDPIQNVDIWVDLTNNSRKRKDHNISLPTGCSPDFSYSTPEAFGTTDQLVVVDVDRVNNYLTNDYPNIDSMFTHTPPWFHNVASRLLSQLGIRFDHITVGNVWNVFGHMIPHIQAHFTLYPPSPVDLLEIPPSPDDEESDYDTEDSHDEQQNEGAE